MPYKQKSGRDESQRTEPHDPLQFGSWDAAERDAVSESYPCCNCGAITSKRTVPAYIAQYDYCEACYDSGE